MCRFQVGAWDTLEACSSRWNKRNVKHDVLRNLRSRNGARRCTTGNQMNGSRSHDSSIRITQRTWFAQHQMLRTVRCKALRIKILLFHIASRWMYDDLITVEILCKGAHSKWTFEFYAAAQERVLSNQAGRTGLWYGNCGTGNTQWRMLSWVLISPWNHLQSGVYCCIWFLNLLSRRVSSCWQSRTYRCRLSINGYYSWFVIYKWEFDSPRRLHQKKSKC